MMAYKEINQEKRVFITGAAGFIGYHLCAKLIELGYKLVCLDNLNNYYDINLKKERIKELKKKAKEQNNPFDFYKANLEDKDILNKIFSLHEPKLVVHLAAQAGVRYSLINPQSYIGSNIVGFSNILEICKEFKVENFIFASSSSVYGGNGKRPFSEKDSVNHPVSLYAATKKSNELMAHCYSHLFGIPTIGLRFFTVYGPWGRPDMAPMIFAKSIYSKKPIKIFNFGKMERDFTYIDDVIEIMTKLLHKPANANKEFDKKNPDPSTSWAPFMIFNIGNSNKIKLMNFIEILEDKIGIKAIKEFAEMQPGDVKSTAADTNAIKKYTDIKPNTNIEKGIEKFINWYKSYYEC